MIIYGTNGAHLRTEPLPGVDCPACALPDTLQLSLYGRYAHIYWIPLFPYSKPTLVQCRHCQGAWEGKALPAAVAAPVRDLKKQTRTPLWHWSGVALLAVASCWGMVASTQDARANAAYLAAPRAGDIYTIQSEEDEKQYSLLKVISAKGNTVEVVANNYQIDNIHPIEALNAPAKYSKESFSLTQFELQIMQNKGQLTDVDRLEE